MQGRVASGQGGRAGPKRRTSRFAGARRSPTRLGEVESSGADSVSHSVENQKHEERLDLEVEAKSR